MIGVQLSDRSARDCDKAHIVVLEVLPRAVDLVGEKRATGTALLPVRTEHEVIHDELAASVEQVAESHRAVGISENIILLDPDPGQRAALCRQAVPLARECLLLGEQRAAGFDPLFFRDDVMLGHEYLLSIVGKMSLQLVERAVPSFLVASARVL